MRTHTPTFGDEQPRVAPTSDRDKRRAKLAAPQPDLSTTEAELAARLSEALEYAPSRQPIEPQRHSQPKIASLIDAPPLRDIDDVSTHERRTELPIHTDEDGDSLQARPPKWLRRSTPKSWRERLSTVSAWMITISVILAIIGTMTVILLGPTRSLTLLAIATDELTDLALSLTALLQKFTR